MATETAAPEKMTLDRADGNSTIDLYRAALGPVRTDYYLKAFTRFDAAGKAGFSWNSAAALLTVNWLAYRKLWIAALAYAGAITFAALLLFGIGRLVFQLSTESQWVLGAIGVLLAIAVPGGLGNAWLYSACNKKMEAALAATATIEEACALLAKQAAGRKGMGAIAAVNLLLAVALAGIVASWPRSTTMQPDTTKSAEAHGAVSGPVQIGLVAQLPAAVPAPQVAASAPEIKASAPAAEAPVATVTAPPAMPHKPTKAEKRLAAKEKAKAPTKPVPQPAPNSSPTRQANTPTTDQYLINVGLFADENNALNAYTKLKDAGLPAVSQPVKSSKGPRTRVRVGPFSTEAEADRAADSIRALQLEAQVFKP